MLEQILADRQRGEGGAGAGGPAGSEFAHRNGRMQIIEGRELKQMLAEALNMDVLISLPVLPPGWERTEIA